MGCNNKKNKQLIGRYRLEEHIKNINILELILKTEWTILTLDLKERARVLDFQV